MPGRERDPAGQGNGDPEGERDERMEARLPLRVVRLRAHTFRARVAVPVLDHNEWST